MQYNAGPDLGMRCPLAESMNTLVHDDEQKMLRSDCMDAHSDLDLRCLQMAKWPFSCVVHHMKQCKAAQSMCQIVYPTSLLL